MKLNLQRKMKDFLKTFSRTPGNHKCRCLLEFYLIFPSNKHKKKTKHSPFLPNKKNN